ncbi:apolipoprotein N-acyltransferase [Mumia sp. zg.B53]|uniref:apolipoprotein N-acyltransferase n=1 Tax=Mumia sp. zg.B53 TaxID=2855449 RepID=UPI001C6ED0E1|nr:apolipoprotein N-acyltransferase [Mumia sp. zg.B53]MBW9213538.1 apolipoprotein N-acyltransferase [Mumia sp. zg.B53]
MPRALSFADRTWFRRTALAVAAGLVVSCGFAPVSQPWSVWPGLILLVVALRGASVGVGAWLGWAFGTSFLLVLLSWVLVFEIPGAYVALAAFEGLFYGAFGAAFAALARLRAWPVLGALAWMAAEMLRSLFPFGGFPWGRLAFAAVDTPLAPIARWLGVSALSGAVFLTAALAVWAFLCWRAESGRVRRLALGAVSVGAVFAVGAVLPVGIAGDGRSMQVAIVQGDVPGTGASWYGEQRQVLENHVRVTSAYAAQVRSGALPPPDLVLWPENASDIDPTTDRAAGEAITRAARDVGAPILVGAILDGPREDTAYNAGLVWDPVTGPGDRYIKQHLVPWGEYVPFRGFSEWLVPLLAEEIPRDILPGDESGSLPIGDSVVGTMMCFDVVFDGLARSAVLGGAELLVVQTNNATFTGTSQPEQQWQISRLRAIESGRYVAVPSTNGISGLIRPDGTVQATAPQEEPGYLAEEIQAATAVTTGTRLGIWIEAAASLTVALVLLSGIRRKVRRR